MKKEIEKLQGTWNVESLEMDGQASSPVMFASAKIVVEGNRFTTSGMGVDYTGVLTVDPTKTPRTFDLQFEAGDMALGIYELDGDTWRICLAVAGNARPTTFATTPNSGHALEVLRREGGKRGKAAAQGTGSKKSAKAKPDIAPPVGDPAPELGGEWAMVWLVNNGQPMEEKFVHMGKRVASANEVKVFIGKQVVMSAKFAVDRSTEPKSINYVLANGQTQHGIYDLEGTTLKTCFCGPNQERPTDFETKAGDGKMLTVWKQLKA